MKKEKENNKHDFVGVGRFSYCKKCGCSILFLGIPQKPCKPKKKKKSN